MDVPESYHFYPPTLPCFTSSLSWTWRVWVFEQPFRVKWVPIYVMFLQSSSFCNIPCCIIVSQNTASAIRWLWVRFMFAFKGMMTRSFLQILLFQSNRFQKLLCMFGKSRSVSPVVKLHLLSSPGNKKEWSRFFFLFIFVGWFAFFWLFCHILLLKVFQPAKLSLKCTVPNGIIHI